jgi:hypothetical protein
MEMISIQQKRPLQPKRTALLLATLVSISALITLLCSNPKDLTTSLRLRFTSIRRRKRKKKDVGLRPRSKSLN